MIEIKKIDTSERRSINGWTCYCEFYEIYRNGLLVATVSEDFGEVRIFTNGKKFDAINKNNCCEHITLVGCDEESLTIKKQSGKEYTFHFYQKPYMNQNEMCQEDEDIPLLEE